MASVFMLVVGACLAMSGGVLMAVFGTDGQVASTKNPVTTPTAAVVTDVASIRDASDLADALGIPVVMLAADGGNASGLFVGIGPAAEVDAYLSGVTIARPSTSRWIPIHSTSLAATEPRRRPRHRQSRTSGSRPRQA